MALAAAAGVSVSAHFGLPFIFPVHPNILLNGAPALMLGSMTVPHPPPESIVAYPAPDIVSMGFPNVLMNGIPAITVGCIAIHPGFSPSVVATGWPNILII